MCRITHGWLGYSFQNASSSDWTCLGHVWPIWSTLWSFVSFERKAESLSSMTISRTKMSLGQGEGNVGVLVIVVGCVLLQNVARGEWTSGCGIFHGMTGGGLCDRGLSDNATQVLQAWTAPCCLGLRPRPPHFCVKLAGTAEAWGGGVQAFDTCEKSFVVRWHLLWDPWCLIVFRHFKLRLLFSLYDVLLSGWLSVYLSVCLFLCLPACLSVCLSVCLFICLSACLSVFLSVCLSTDPPLHMISQTDRAHQWVHFLRMEQIKSRHLKCFFINKARFKYRSAF